MIKSTKDFCSQIPKVELHAHLGGSISDETFESLLHTRSELKGSLQRFHQTKGKLRTMEECFAAFALIPQLVNNLDTLYKVTCAVLNDFKRDNVLYLELRTEPKSFSSDCSQHDYVATILKAFHDCDVVNPKCGDSAILFARLILSISRRMTAEEAMAVVELCHQFRDSDIGQEVIVGLDLGGDPNKGRIHDYLPALQKAKSGGLSLSIHMAEVAGQNEEFLPLLSLPPDRIGHGTFLHPQSGGLQEAVDLIKLREIPIEVCLTSNIKCQTVRDYSSHHLDYWRKQGHTILICTDDKGIFGSDLSDELLIASQNFSLSRDEICQLTLDAIEHAFCTESLKVKLKQILNHWKENNCVN